MTLEKFRFSIHWVQCTDLDENNITDDDLIY